MSFENNKVTMLRELGAFANGINFSKNDFGRGVDVVNVKQLFGGRHVVFESLDSIQKSAVSNIERLALKEGDILFARSSVKRSGSGQVALVCFPPKDTIFSGFIIRFRIADKSAAIPEYLNYLLRSPIYREIFQRIANGTTIYNLSQETLSSVEVFLPPPYEQKSIAHILGTLDDKIELNRKTNETLEAMAKALFKSWFVDFDPVRAKAEGRPSGLPAEISDLFPDSFEDSELGEIPSGWRVAPVGDFVECVGGSTPSTNEPEYWDGGEYFWATPKDLSSLSEPFLLDTAKKITADGVQRISSGILPVGTVLISSRAPVGYVAAACVPVSINQGFIALKSNGLMSSAYLLNWCLSNVQQFKDRASGTTFAEISKAAFRPIPLLVPSEQVARLFSDKAQTLYERVVSTMRQSTLLAATRDALLPKLISGEIRIPDAEKMLEEVGI
jgi:type I restriction enzyme S subunit